MKTYQKLVLCLILSVVVLFSSGCVVTAAQRAFGNINFPPPAGVDVTNNLSNKTIVLSTTRESGPVATLASGQTAHVGVCGLYEGSRFIITAKVYDQSGRYLGMVENQSGVYFDSGGRFNTTWMVSDFNKTNN